MRGLGFRVQDSGIRLGAFRLRLQDLRCRAWS